MPRQERTKSGTGIYHVMLRGINKQDMFEDDEDYLQMTSIKTKMITEPSLGHTGIVNGGVLTISGTTTLTGNSKIRVCEGGILIVDGGTLQNADITMVPGSTLIIRNNGVINMASGKEFIAPVGTIVNIESGEIN